MNRSQLETKYLKTKTQTDLKLHKKHKNFCSKLYKRERRNNIRKFENHSSVQADKFSVKNQKNVRIFLELFEKWLPYNLTRFFLNPFSTGKIENLIRKLTEYSLKTVLFLKKKLFRF